MCPYTNSLLLNRNRTKTTRLQLAQRGWRYNRADAEDGRMQRCVDGGVLINIQSVSWQPTGR